MVKAVHEYSKFNPANESHVALPDVGMVEVMEVVGAMRAIADLADAGTRGPAELEGSRSDLADLFRVLARSAELAVEGAPTVFPGRAN